MRIIIKDISVCENCTHKTCSMNNVIVNTEFYNLRTEQYTCPTRLLEQGLRDQQLKNGDVDTRFKLSKDTQSPLCIHCCLCVKNCSHNNLEIIEETSDAYSFNKELQLLKNEDVSCDMASNSVVTSYLNYLYDFSANTNIIKTLHFDGYVSSANATGCFVEIDIGDDSLESCRRILADIVTHNHSRTNKVYNGLVVLSSFPKKGSDVFTQIESIKEFPGTTDINIFFTTFAFLRYLVIKEVPKNMPFKELFFSLANESKEEYVKRLVGKQIIEKDIADFIFE